MRREERGEAQQASIALGVRGRRRNEDIFQGREGTAAVAQSGSIDLQLGHMPARAPSSLTVPRSAAGELCCILSHDHNTWQDLLGQGQAQMDVKEIV